MAIAPPADNTKQTKTIPTIYPGQNAQVVQPGTTNVTGTTTTGAGGAPQIGAVTAIPSGITDQTGANAAVLAAGQNKAIQGFKSPTLDLTSEKTRKLLANPTFVYNPQAAVKPRMDAYNQSLNKSLENLRRQTAPLSGFGGRLNDLIDVAMRNEQDRALMRADLEEQAATFNIDALRNALEAGRKTSETERQRFATDIDALVDVRGAAEGERADIAESGERATDRGLEAAVANLGAATDVYRDRTSQEFQRSERIATQDWKTSERVGSQDWEEAMKWVDYQIADAIANDDVGRQEYLLGLKFAHDTEMQTAGFSHDERMKYVDERIAEAKAEGDVGREKQLIDYRAAKDVALINTRYGLDTALAHTQGQIEQAIRNNDHSNAMAYMREEMQLKAEELAKDRLLDQAKIELDKYGVNMDYLMQQVEAGMIEPEAAIQMAQGQLDQYGVKLQIADPMAMMQEAIEAEFESQKYQWAQTAPEEQVYIDADGKLALTKEGLEEFNDHFNSTIYGKTDKVEDLVNGIIEVASLQGASNPDHDMNDTYNKLLTQSSEWTPSVWRDGRGFFNPDVYKFDNPPASGSYFKINGKLYKATSGVKEEKKGQNYQYFKAIDVDTGQTTTIRADEAMKGRPAG